MKKFLSLILAITLVASLFTVNVMAGSKAHEVTITADKTTELKAGDEVEVKLLIDGTLGIGNCEYVLSYDTSAFEIDTTVDEDDYIAYVDMDWIDDITYNKGTWKNWTKALSTMLYTPSADDAGEVGKIKFTWFGTSGVSSDYDDCIIGWFKIKVKEGAADGNYTFSLTGKTGDAVENDSAAMISTPVTVTVGEEKQEATPSVNTEFGTATAAGIAANRGGVEFVYDNAYAVTVKMSNTNEATKAGIQFIPALVLATNGNSWDDAAEAVFTTGLGAGEAEFTAALINIPRKFAGQTIKMMARGFVVVGENTITGKEVEKDITYTVTAEPGQN